MNSPFIFPVIFSSAKEVNTFPDLNKVDWVILNISWNHLFDVLVRIRELGKN